MPNPSQALPSSAAVSREGPRRVTLTEKRVATLPRPESGGEVCIYDDDQPGLVLRMRADSMRWYCYRWAGRQRKLLLGDWPAVSVEIARELCQEALVKLKRGIDPIKEKRASAVAAKGGKYLLSDVIDHVIKRMETNDRAARHTAERKRVGLALVAAGLKDLGNPRSCAIAEKWINEQTCGDLTKHRYGMHVRALGRAALKKYPDIPHDPFRALEVGSATIPAPAVFTLPELITLASDAAMTTAWGRLFAFLLYTGARLREGEYARWSRINLDDATFAVLPPSVEQRAAGEAVKRNKGRTVTLQAELVEILRGWKKQAGAADFLKSSPATRPWSFAPTWTGWESRSLNATSTRCDIHTAPSPLPAASRTWSCACRSATAGQR